MGRRTVLLIRSGMCGWNEVRSVLCSMPEVQLVGEATNGTIAMKLAATHRPAVIIAPETLDNDASLPLLSTLRRNVVPEAKVIILASRLRPSDISGFAEIGVSAHVLWADLSLAVFQQMVALLLRNPLVVASEEVVTVFMGLQNAGASSRRGEIPLTERERAVLRRLAEGRTHGEIASIEPMSRRTVERIVANLQAKLNAPSAFVLGLRAYEHGLIELDNRTQPADAHPVTRPTVRSL